MADVTLLWGLLLDFPDLADLPDFRDLPDLTDLIDLVDLTLASVLTD